MPDSSIHLSVVVAAYNEASIIGHNLKRIVDELATRPDVSWEIVCVNDGSKDITGSLMDEFARTNSSIRVLHHRRNFGQGRALRTAFDCCQGDIIVTLDADLSYGPEYIYRLMDELNEKNVEIALASPYMKGGTVRNVPFYRYFLSRWGNSYLARMSHYPIATSTCVVRAYRKEVFDSLVLTSDGMELQLEVLMKASMMGLQVCEVPAHLEWDNSKVAEADIRRVSKMRILRTIQLYLMMGWLSRPAFVFLILSLFMILPGLYMALTLLVRAITLVWKHIAEGFLQAISTGLQELFVTYTYSIVFCGGLLLIGLQIFAFALLVLQNKYYFEEIYRLGQNKKVQAERNQFFMRNK
jgi:glycosyltransferase involved in cell wall biosynthesis